MKVIAYTSGDSNKTSTWSNVPYFFLKTLEEKGHEVIRVNIALEDSNLFSRIFIKGYNKIYRKFHKNGLFIFNRRSIYKKIVRKKMKEALDQHQDVDLLVSFDFSSSISDLTDVKTLLFCDWTIEYLIRHLQKRLPTKQEENLISEQNRIIDTADYVVTIFPNSQEFMQSRTKNKIRYYGNVINAMTELPPVTEMSKTRYNSRNILFIGSRKYSDAATTLIAAVKHYNETHKTTSPFSVQIIGMTKDQLSQEDFVQCFGYLDKCNPRENEKYYRLIQNAKFLVNTQPNWTGASSIIEVLHYGLPVIITETPDLYKTFGREIGFGFYCKENSEGNICRFIDKIQSLSFEEYENMSFEAEKAVQDFTWDAYMDRLLKDIEMTL